LEADICANVGGDDVCLPAVVTSATPPARTDTDGGCAIAVGSSGRGAAPGAWGAPLVALVAIAGLGRRRPRTLRRKARA
jgi:hypothetical protein